MNPLPTSSPAPAPAPVPAASPAPSNAQSSSGSYASPSPQLSQMLAAAKAQSAPKNNSGGFLSQLQSGAYRTSTAKTTTATDPLASVHIGEDQVENPVDEVKNTAESGASQAEQGFGEAKNATNPVQLLEGSLRGAAGTINAVTSPLAPVMAPISKMVNSVGDKISDIPAVQRFAQSPAGNVASRIATDAGDADTVAGAVVSPDAAEEAAPAVKGATEGAVNAVKDTAGTVKNAADTAANKVRSVISKTPEEKTAAAKNAIDTEIRNTASKYPSVSKVLNKSEVVNKTDPVSVLSSYENGKALPTISKGKLQVDNATGFLKTQIGRLSEIKNNLVATGKNNTSIGDFQDRAKAIIDSQKGWSLARKGTAKADVTKLTNPWSDVYPDGIPNTELDSLKTEHTNESSSYNSKSPFNLDAHAVVGKAARQLVESNAEGAPIGELNKLIQSHYDATTLLNSMRGKAPHGGALSHMMNNTIGEVGGLAGGLAVGHPFIGAMAGRAGAEAINEIINNHFISNPLKRSIVNNMPNTDPEVVQSALDYLDSNSPQTESKPSEQGQSQESSE